MVSWPLFWMAILVQALHLTMNWVLRSHGALPWTEKRQYLKKVQTEINTKTSSLHKSFCIINRVGLKITYLTDIYKVSEKNIFSKLSFVSQNQ